MTRRARLLAMLAAALLAGCSADRAAEPAPPPGPVGPVTARFAPGDVNQIEVTVTDRLPARMVELVAPDGSVQRAQSIDTARATGGLGGRGIGQVGPQVGIGVGGFGGGGNLGPGIGAPLGRPAATASSSDIVSDAFIPLPDPLQYRQTWPAWRIRVRLGDPPGETRSFELPAPAPPP